ncbi:cupin domain-containing protein [Streptomyces sp. NPDC020996]|uniref:cupin domain-containing protein n=1 Tax=Streptomyces sp. NPDC020996 TaxID=3154791 RepID=UPI0033FA6E9B
MSAVENLPIFREVAGHHQPAPFLITSDMFGGLPIELAGAEISDLVGKPVAEPHVHDVPELYLLVSARPGEAEITIEVEDSEYTVTSPAVFRVPAGKRHRFVTRRAAPGSYCFGIFLLGEDGA